MGLKRTKEDFPMRPSCGAPPPTMKKSRIEANASMQRSALPCVYEPDHETDPGVCRNHPLSRYRVRLTEEKAREVNRVQKTLEDTNLKLGDVVSDSMEKPIRAD